MNAAKKILVVDDDPGIQFMIRRLLEKKGYSVEVAGNGDHCLQLLGTYSPDLIILDVAMPGMGGISALEQIKRHEIWSQLPVVLISGDPSHEKTQAVSRLGGDDFLAKPFKSDDLISRISKHLLHLDFTSLKALLFQLRTRDANLSALAGFAANKPCDVHSASYQGVPILILTPPGFDSKDTRLTDENSAAIKIQVLANLGFSWKRLWPHVSKAVQDVKKVG